MSIQPRVAMVALFVAVILGGCASDLPVYPAMSDADAIAAIATRQSALKSISAECDLDLTDAQGQRVRLEGVLVADLPHRMRLRAWKFGAAIFDLTLADGKGWVLLPEDGPGAHRLDVDQVPVRRVGEALALLGPEYFRTARPAGGEPGVLRAQGSAFGRNDVACEIERLTLTPRRFIVESGEASPPSELLLDDYTRIGDLVWPCRLRLRSPSGEVLIRVRELELNGELPPGAFTPPTRAKALP